MGFEVDVLNLSISISLKSPLLRCHCRSFVLHLVYHTFLVLRLHLSASWGVFLSLCACIAPSYIEDVPSYPFNMRAIPPSIKLHVLRHKSATWITWPWHEPLHAFVRKHSDQCNHIRSMVNLMLEAHIRYPLYTPLTHQYGACSGSPQ